MAYNNLSSNAIVGIQKSSYQDLNVESLLMSIGGLKKYINQGERVLLKTNILTASEPKDHVVTHPTVVGAVAKEVLKIGGIPYIGDSPSGQFTKRRLEKVYKKSGLKKIADELGIELNYDTAYKNIQVPNGKKLRKVSICNFVLDADKIIALPKIKTHSLMMLTLATKIMYGAVPGLTKVRYHSKYIRRKAFAEMLIDVLSITLPDIIIMDGIIGMQGNGPAGGDPADLGILLASDNPFAMDLSICKILDIEPMGIPTLKQAKIRNLWPLNIEYPLFSPEDVKFNGFILPSSAGYLLTGEKKPRVSPVPTDKCIACGDCKKVCPRNVITIDKIAKIDYSKCIKCYCCHEVCAYKAIKLEVI
jgi:uncharacterized protein (DUF362 family)/Pyruvate/2-oxoacid:ferredoxin oxidoreductase delta subunit